MIPPSSSPSWYAFGAVRATAGGPPEPVLRVDGSNFLLRNAWTAALPGTTTVIRSLQDVIQAASSERQRVVQWCLDVASGGPVRNRAAVHDEVLAPDDAAIACPLVPLQRDVVCVGLNYHAHVAEGARPAQRSAEAPSLPIYFSKAAASIVGPHDAIDAHPALTTKLDYEVELAVVMANDCRDLTPERALDSVFGYAVFNDVSARDVQAARKQWYLGKSLDRTSPLGPWIVPPDVIGDPHALELELRVNGLTRQRASTSQMIFSLTDILCDLTAGHTLHAGQVVATGTPEGCGYAMQPPSFLAAGDLVEATITNLGSQRNRVVDPDDITLSK